MIRNYLKIALRNIRKQKIYSLINFIGLAIGLSVTLVITLYVIDDMTFDRFHENKDQIYRILSIGVKRGTKNSITAGALVQNAMEAIPEVRFATRVARGGSLSLGPVSTNFNSPEEGSTIRAEAILADTQFFNVFSFKILEGMSGEALSMQENVLLTPRVAQALFADENPVGQPIAIRGLENARVVGIVEEPPSNSHIQFEMILPLIPERNPRFWNSWDTLAIVGYVLLEKNTDPHLVTEKIKKNAYANKFPEIFEPRLQPLKDIHLGSTDHFYDHLNSGRSDKVVFYTMGFVGILVLLVACINFINLMTSRASQRGIEVGLRKVVGSSKRQIVMQFLSESTLFTILTFIAALAIVQTVLPYLNTIMNKELSLDIGQNLFLFLAFFVTAVLVGFLSGLYPAFVISAYMPSNVLKGQFKTGKEAVLLRRTLVVFQFAITTVLIISVFIVIAQIDYLKSMDLGYNRSQVVAIPNGLREGDDLLKHRLSSLSSVVSVGRIDALPGPNFWRFELIREGHDRSENFTASRFNIDEDAFKTLEISMSEGRNFSSEFPSDATDAIIVNETLVQKFNYKNPIGSVLRYYDESNENQIVSRKIIGVIKDFHYITARQKSEPMIFLLNPRQSYFLTARIAPGKVSETLARIEEAHKTLYPDRTFRYFFLEDTFDEQFNNDREFMRNVSIFAGLAVFIGCLGLIGLVAFTIEQRRKEIAIRKILGCGEGKVYALLASDLIKWVLLANLFAWPAAYLASQSWLNDFVFRIPFQPWIFVLPSLISLFIALITISFQTFRAVRSEPVNALREIG
jgi:putative ABC transport system permease protein